MPRFKIGDILVWDPNAQNRYELDECKIINKSFDCYIIEHTDNGYIEKEYFDVIDKVYMKKPINTNKIWDQINT